MRVTVEPTYEMYKSLGVSKFELDDVQTVADVINRSRDKVGPDFEKFVRVAAVVINGVMVNHRKGSATRLADGDVVSFVKASAGG